MIDTRDKRAAAIHISLPWRGMLPTPDGHVSAGDRRQAAWLYRDLLTLSATRLIKVSGADISLHVLPGCQSMRAISGSSVEPIIL